MPEQPATDYSALASLRRELAALGDDHEWSLDMLYEILAELPAGDSEDDYEHWTNLPGPLGVLEAAVDLGYARRGSRGLDPYDTGFYATTPRGRELVEMLKPIVMAIGAQRGAAAEEEES